MMTGHRARTVIIDDADAGGSHAGAWATAIAHTPHLAAQVQEITAVPHTSGDDRAGETGPTDAPHPVRPVSPGNLA